jgi:hypothetical protein
VAPGLVKVETPGFEGGKGEFEEGVEICRGIKMANT